MSNKINISIPKPCHENWEAMTLEDKGRFCSICTKTVFDFTKASDKEIIEHLNKDKNTCGRFVSSQLNRDLIVQNEKSSYWIIATATLFSFLGIGSQATYSQVKLDTIQTDKKNLNQDSIKTEKNPFTITGVVSDELGPIAGVNIVVKGTIRGTTTDFDGKFAIKANEKEVLIFTYTGKKTIEVDRNTHWYFKKFLAHKVAYQNQIGVFASSTQRLSEVQIQGPVTMATLAKRFGVSEAHLIEYNKWAHQGKVPAGTFTLFYIKEGNLPVEPAVQKTEEKPSQPKTAPTKNTKASPAYKQANSYPRISGNTTKANQPNQITVNELSGVQAPNTMSPSKFADEIGMKEKKFLKVNDFPEEEKVETGKYYYTEKKKASADVETHVVQPGEDLWSISQKYGIRLASLKSKNRIRKDSELKPGMVLNLREPRKRGEAIPVVQVVDPEPTVKPVISEPVITPVKEEPKVQPTQPSTIYHTVSQGETLFAISRKYGITVDELKRWNNIGSQNIITIGQKLVILKQ